MATTARKDFPVFDCDSHVVEPPAIWDEYVPREEPRVDQDPVLLSHRQRPSVHQRSRGPCRPGALERRRGGLGALGQEGSGQAHPGTAAWQEKFGRLLGCRDPRARLNDMDALGTDQVMLFPTWFVRLALVRSAEAAAMLAQAYNNWVLDYCAADRRRLFPCAVLPLQSVEASIGRAEARGRARLQGGGRAPLLLERSLSDLARVRSALARVRGRPAWCSPCTPSLARGADARLGPAHGPSARPFGAGAPVHRRSRRLLARPVRVEHHRGHGPDHRRLRDARAS